QHEFQVIFYNTTPTRMDGGGKLLTAERVNIERIKRFLDTIVPSGGTEHLSALNAAMDLNPEVIYFLTDADNMTDRDVLKLSERNHRQKRPATIFAVEFGQGPAGAVDKPLRRFARDNDGVYTYVNVETLGGGR
ncbi:MAG: hypothetical protein ACRDD1_10810, partial [Planctomycetia bacterium]